jgi:hypothetical protein
MSYQLLAWLLAGTFLTCCGCVVAVVGERRRARRLAALMDDMSRATDEEPQTHAKLEGLVRELHTKLAKTEGNCRRVLGVNEQIAKELESRSAALRSLESAARAQNETLDRLQQERDGWVARIREQGERLERDAARIAELESQVHRSEELGQNAASQASQLQDRAQRELAAALSAHAAENEASAERVRSLEAENERRSSELREAAQRESALSARVQALETELSRLDESSLQRVATLEGLRDELKNKSREAATLGARCEELELHLEQQVESEQRRVRQVEEQVESRDVRLRTQVAAFESLQLEMTARNRTVEDLGRHCAELEQQLRQHADLAQRRIGELEHVAASREAEWREQLAAAQAARTELGAKDLGLEDLGRRCQGLEKQVLELKGSLADAHKELGQRGAASEALERELGDWRHKHDALVQRGAELARLREQENEAARAAQQGARDMECRLAERIGHLETTLEHRDEELRQRSAAVEQLERQFGEVRRNLEVLDQRHASVERELQDSRGRCAALTERWEDVSESLEQRGRELVGRDRQLVEAAAQVNELHAELDRSRASSESDRAPMDEMVDGRLATLFRRRADQVIATLPEPYAAGLAKKDLSLALRGLLGDSAPLSGSAFAKLAERWHDENRAWKRRRIERRVAYLWADGVHVKDGPPEKSAENSPDSSPSMLMVLAAFVDGSRELIALESGERGNVDVWRDALRSLVERGMNVPRLVVADGDLGLWPAVAELGWNDVQQFCWDHEIVRAVAALPKCRRRRAGELLAKIAESESRTGAAKLRDLFLKRYCAHRPIAGERVHSEWAHMSRFFALPKQHWHHLRTVAVVGSPLASMRLSSLPPKAWEHVEHVDAVLWKLAVVAAKTLRPLDAPELLPSLTAGPGQIHRMRRRRSAA